MRVLVLGCGYTGLEVARQARAQGHEVTVTVRATERAQALQAQGLDVRQHAALDETIVRALCNDDTHVVVTFPPDGETCARVAPALAGARSSVVVSSTGVYGATRGQIDETTPVPQEQSESVKRQLRAEEAYLEAAACVVRASAIYGPDRGLHLRMLRGQHQIPGDGTRYTSRIHVSDLAAVLLACVDRKRLVFPLGDSRPTTQLEIATYIARTYQLPVPPFAPMGAVHSTFQGDRQVDARRTLALLGVSLSSPTYEEGMNPTATGMGPGAEGPRAT